MLPWPQGEGRRADGAPTRVGAGGSRARQAGQLHLLDVALEPASEALDAGRLPEPEVPVGAHRALEPLKAGPGIALGLGGRFPPERLHHAEQVERVSVLGLDDQLPKGVGQTLREAADRGFGRGAVAGDLLFGRERRSDQERFPDRGRRVRPAAA